MTTTPKQQAILDIKEDLAKNHKCFIAFRNELNPVMRHLVSIQIHMQMSVTPKH